MRGAEAAHATIAGVASRASLSQIMQACKRWRSESPRRERGRDASRDREVWLEIFQLRSRRPAGSRHDAPHLRAPWAGRPIARHVSPQHTESRRCKPFWLQSAEITHDVSSSRFVDCRSRRRGRAAHRLQCLGADDRGRWLRNGCIGRNGIERRRLGSSGRHHEHGSPRRRQRDRARRKLRKRNRRQRNDGRQ